MKKTHYAIDPSTGEIHERTPDKAWQAAHKAWCEALQQTRKRGSYFRPCVPRPMPFGHIMFEIRKRNQSYPSLIRTDVLPRPIWTDGTACLYAGQKIGWCEPDRRTWHWGVVRGVETVDGKTMLDVFESGHLDGHTNNVLLDIDRVE